MILKREEAGFMMLQVLPTLLATVMAVAALLTCYGQGVRTMSKHNRLLEAQSAGEEYCVQGDPAILEAAGLTCQEKLQAVGNRSVLRELLFYDGESGRFLLNLVRVENHEW